MGERKLTLDTEVLYCPVCGHSAGPSGRWSDGQDNCRGDTLKVIPFSAWLQIARGLKLTPAGRSALEASNGRS